MTKMMILFASLLIALAGAIGLDFVTGDPPNRYHPVAWLGRIVGHFVTRLKQAGSNEKEKAKGAAFAILLLAFVGVGVHLGAIACLYLAGAVAFVIFSALILKVTIAVRGMQTHARAIMDCIKIGDLPSARRNLSMIVRRPTDDLDEQHVLSATIESISESTVDGITGPLFYYSLFGPAGAFGYRVINTLDSMVGYRDKYYRDIGWMSARLDTLCNYIPARITALLMVVSANILGEDWKNSLGIMQRDHGKTFSPNAGYPMATMAGALRIRLEKIGHYSLGDSQEHMTLQKCETAISIMKLTTFLFFLAFSVPTVSILYLVGWWRLLFGLPP
jgi:adenosylcobinamide-phosphate synthase